ncbi:hypothetical protein CLI79_03450 [Porphyromonas gingivalis]|uniref:hypothetical protein n=1 Tax=Porphyromonas gingivalis TaxID=837 RepID=UPI00041839A8|nr:hypothetical protein [Porphyromonas gingivalis]PDP62312.1 hypothetical protein CLI83_06175 [Porphyromonas gingivalis]PDP75540.1 hypothetical protein CLI79_03450 [Porphyromonas gingivalis]
MGVEAQFTTEVVRERFEAFLQEIVRQQVEALQQLGEMCVIHARSIPKEQGFEDQTGNLRSSIGYVVFVDGVAVHSLYEEVKGGSIGAKTGEALAHKVGQGTQGVCLVVTAGMNYALHVESRGRDVIASAEQLAERELPRMIEQLISDIKSI